MIFTPDPSWGDLSVAKYTRSTTAVGGLVVRKDEQHKHEFFYSVVSTRI